MSQASINEAQRLRKKRENLQMIEELLKRQAEISITADGLEEWTFVPGYDGMLFDSLSSSDKIKKITLPNSFQQNIKKLPRQLQTISFGRDYDKTVYNIPASLKYVYYKGTKPKIAQERENIMFYDQNRPTFIPEPIVLADENNNAIDLTKNIEELQNTYNVLLKRKQEKQNNKKNNDTINLENNLKTVQNAICQEIGKLYDSSVLECGVYREGLQLIVKQKIDYNVIADLEVDIEFMIILDSNPITKLPKTCTILEIGNNFNHVLPKEVILNVRYLKIGDGFNQFLEVPDNCKVLELGSSFQQVIRSFPQTLERLEIKGNYLYDLPDGFESIKEIEVYGMQDVSEIQRKVKEIREITMKNLFLCNNDGNMILDKDFIVGNVSLKGMNVKMIDIRGNFNQYLPDFPASLKTFRIGFFESNFNKQLPNLPNGLETLIFSAYSSYNKIIPPLPETLKYFTIGRNLDIPNLPRNLYSFHLAGAFNKIIKEFPPKLHELQIDGQDFNQELPDLPTSLKTLLLNRAFNQQLPNLPNSLETFSILTNSQYDKMIPQLPESLRYFIIGKNLEIPNLPRKLYGLQLEGTFNKIIGEFPPNLYKLEIIGFFNQPLPELPSSLYTLEIYSKYTYDLPSNFMQIRYLNKVQVYGKTNKRQIFEISEQIKQQRLQAEELIKQKTVELKENINNLTNRRVLYVTGNKKELVLDTDFDISMISWVDYDIYKIRITGYFNQSFNNLPKSLKVLRIGGIYNKELPDLPDGLESLVITSSSYDMSHAFGRFYKQKAEEYGPGIKKLPDSLQVLDVSGLGQGGAFVEYVLPDLPNSIKKLTFVASHIPKLPSSLEQLKFKTLLRKEPIIIKDLPNTLVKLEIIGNNFIFDKEFPNRLEELSIKSNDFNQRFEKIPETLKKLHLDCNSYNQLLPLPDLPDTIETLIITNPNYKFDLPEINRELIKEIKVYGLEDIDEILQKSNEIQEKRDYAEYYINVYTKKELDEYLQKELVTLTLSDDFDTSAILWEDYLEIEKIVINGEFNQPFDVFPKNLLVLIIGNISVSKSYIIENSSNDTVGLSSNNLINFLFTYDQKLPDLPESLRCLHINSYYYDQNLPTLPHNLSKLVIISSGKNIKFRIVKSLKEFVFRNISRSAKFETLPDGLEKLDLELKSLTCDFKLLKNCKELRLHVHNLNSVLHVPDTLQKLEIYSNSFNQTLPQLPQSLKELYIHSYVFNQILPQLPQSLQYLHIFSNSFNQPLPQLRQSLQNLHIFSNSFNQPLPQLPQSLKELIINDVLPQSIEDFNLRSRAFNQPLPQLPKSLETLILRSRKFNQILPQLPHSLQKLKISSDSFNQRLPQLPHSLQKLEISSYSFNQRLPQLPKSLQHLYILCNTFNQPLPQLPQSLQYLHIVSNSFNQPLPKLPQSLQQLDMNVEYKQKYNIDLLNYEFGLTIENKSVQKDKYIPYHNALIDLIPNFENVERVQQMIDLQILIYDFETQEITFNVSDASYIFYNMIAGEVPIDNINVHTNRKLDFFPPTLKKLEFKVPYTHRIPRLPDGLKKLNLTNINRKLSNKIAIPSSVNELIAPKVSTQQMKKVKSLKLNPGNMARLLKGNNKSKNQDPFNLFNTF